MDDGEAASGDADDAEDDDDESDADMGATEENDAVEELGG